MYSRRNFVRHGLVSISFVLIYLALNRPEIVFFSRIGFVAWYPAIGPVMALMLGVSPCTAFWSVSLTLWLAELCMASLSSPSAAHYACSELQPAMGRQPTYCEGHSKSISDCVAVEMSFSIFLLVR